MYEEVYLFVLEFKLHNRYRGSTPLLLLYKHSSGFFFFTNRIKNFFGKMTRGKQHKWLNVLSQNIITKLRKIRLNQIPIEYKVSSHLPIRGQKRTEIET